MPLYTKIRQTNGTMYVIPRYLQGSGYQFHERNPRPRATQAKQQAFQIALSVRSRVGQLHETVHDFQLAAKLHLLLPRVTAGAGPVQAGLPEPQVVVARQSLS
jgi:hypothetical protein